MERVLSDQISKFVGQKAKISGWVGARRDHGKLIFIDLRDRKGLTQVVFIPKDKELYAKANLIRPEWVVEIEGIVNNRPKGMENPKIDSGHVEILAEKLEILNEAKTLPFEIGDTTKISEELRLKYRYLDLRSERMQKNLKTRTNIITFFRNFLIENDFVEVETPDLTKGTPEGAREYVVPSRLQPGKFYVLPQSPQQFKQLLMVAGFERYFQIVRCFRDEDPRGDRQPEFTQLDIEMSFISEEDILKVIEEMLIKTVNILLPDYKILKVPFPRIDYDEAIKKYKSDKPDLRQDKNNPKELAFAWVLNFPLFEYSETEKKLVSAHHPFTSPKDEDIEMLDSEPKKVKARAYDIVLNGYEIGGGSIRIHKRELQNKIFEILGLKEKEINARFGHMLEAFEYGAPPHGGIALGIDRIIAIIQNESSIREVIAFPKTGDARDLMMGAPSEISKGQMKELHLKIEK